MAIVPETGISWPGITMDRSLWYAIKDSGHSSAITSGRNIYS